MQLISAKQEHLHSHQSPYLMVKAHPLRKYCLKPMSTTSLTFKEGQQQSYNLQQEQQQDDFSTKKIKTSNDLDVTSQNSLDSSFGDLSHSKENVAANGQQEELKKKQPQILFKQPNLKKIYFQKKRSNLLSMPKNISFFTVKNHEKPFFTNKNLGVSKSINEQSTQDTSLKDLSKEDTHRESDESEEEQKFKNPSSNQQNSSCTASASPKDIFYQQQQQTKRFLQQQNQQLHSQGGKLKQFQQILNDTFPSKSQNTSADQKSQTPAAQNQGNNNIYSNQWQEYYSRDLLSTSSQQSQSKRNNFFLSVNQNSNNNTSNLKSQQALLLQQQQSQQQQQNVQLQEKFEQLKIKEQSTGEDQKQNYYANYGTMQKKRMSEDFKLDQQDMVFLTKLTMNPNFKNELLYIFRENATSFSLNNVSNIDESKMTPMEKLTYYKKQTEQLLKFISNGVLKRDCKTGNPEIVFFNIKQAFSSSKSKSTQTSHVLPESKKDYTIVLDLDETLIHSKFLLNYDDPDMESDDRCIMYIRPFAYEFLKNLSEVAELVVFTAGTRNYAEQVVNILDPERRLISHILSREHLTYSDESRGCYYKDLYKLGRNMQKTILIDNDPNNFFNNKLNGYQIKDWRGEYEDIELQILQAILLLFVRSNRDMRELGSYQLMVRNGNQTKPIGRNN